MGRIAKLLSFVRLTRNDAKVNDVKVDTGGGSNLTVEHFTSPGDDSFPLVGDYLTILATPRSGGGVAVGYLDSINVPKALEGDKRIYSRDPSDGSVASEIWLKNDGKIAIGNDTEELLNLIDEILTTIQAITTNTSIGPQPIINLTDFTDLQTRLATIKGTL